MSASRLLLIACLLALPTGPLCAQTATNADIAPARGTTDGPVVMPPPGKGPEDATNAPPLPGNASASTPALPDTSQVTPMPPSAASVTTPDDDNETIDGIRPAPRSWLWLWLIPAALLLTGLIVFLVLWLLRRSPRAGKTAYELTLERLEQARGLMDESDPRPYANAVSEVLRTYLGQRFQARSTLRTTDEFLREMEAGTAVPLAEHRELLCNFLQACDLLKFAQYRPGRTELEQVQASAVTFVTATKPVPLTPGAPPPTRQLVPGAA